MQASAHTPQFPRAAGILLPLSSLPSPYGIGTMGEESYRWVDFLCAAGQTYWQVLPLTPVGPGNSPYQSVSAFAGNPYFIDLDILITQGLLQKSEVTGIRWSKHKARVEYATLHTHRVPLLRLAYARFLPDSGYYAFLQQQAHWVFDYALYRSIAHEFAPLSWTQWPEPLRLHNTAALQTFQASHMQEVGYYLFEQYQFFSQWMALKSYANAHGVRIIGDIPIYIAMESVDSWAHRTLFLLDELHRPTDVAGVPPDYFSADGQLWGNPLYRWEVLRETGYRWWLNRLQQGFLLHDVLRIDHFRGLESYYCVPFGQESAREGVWRKGPGMDFLNAVRHELPASALIAEDLGIITLAVRDLQEQSGCPGMKVLCFAFDGDRANEHLPHHYTENSIVYTGTHDNNTLRGFLHTASDHALHFAEDYCGETQTRRLHKAIVRLALHSVAHTAILPLQDYIGLGEEARINTPATVGGSNWCWRIKPHTCTPLLARKIIKLCRQSDRVPQ